MRAAQRFLEWNALDFPRFDFRDAADDLRLPRRGNRSFNSAMPRGHSAGDQLGHHFRGGAKDGSFTPSRQDELAGNAPSAVD